MIGGDYAAKQLVKSFFGNYFSWKNDLLWFWIVYQMLLYNELKQNNISDNQLYLAQFLLSINYIKNVTLSMGHAKCPKTMRSLSYFSG